MLKKADQSKDTDDIREAFEVYSRNAPEMTLQDIEKRFREENFNTHLVAHSKELAEYMTIVNLQKEPEQRFTVGFQLSAQSRRNKMTRDTKASSPEENFERLATAGFAVKKPCIICHKVCPPGMR